MLARIIGEMGDIPGPRSASLFGMLARIIGEMVNIPGTTFPAPLGTSFLAGACLFYKMGSFPHPIGYAHTLIYLQNGLCDHVHFCL